MFFVFAHCRLISRPVWRSCAHSRAHLTIREKFFRSVSSARVSMSSLFPFNKPPPSIDCCDFSFFLSACECVCAWMCDGMCVFSCARVRVHMRVRVRLPMRLCARVCVYVCVSKNGLTSLFFFNSRKNFLIIYSNEEKVLFCLLNNNPPQRWGKGGRLLRDIQGM